MKVKLKRVNLFIIILNYFLLDICFFPVQYIIWSIMLMSWHNHWSHCQDNDNDKGISFVGAQIGLKEQNMCFTEIFLHFYPRYFISQNFYKEKKLFLMCLRFSVWNWILLKIWRDKKFKQKRNRWRQNWNGEKEGRP